MKRPIRNKRNIDRMTSSNSKIDDLSSKRNGIERTVLTDAIYMPEIVTSFAKGKTYHIRTYGCQGNVRDGETISGLLELLGFSCVDNLDDADILLLNTCAIRENAEDKVYGKVGEVIRLKRNNPNLIFGICGCIPQESDITKDMLQRFPQIDLMFGTHNIQNIPLLLEELIREKKTVVEIITDKAIVVENLPSKRQSKIKGFVNVMYGCDKFCTYCIVPYTRGKERSRNIEDIKNEIQKMIDTGYKEVTLVGQSINNYGYDINNSFSNLLKEVADMDIPRIRFTTSNPWNFSDELIDIIATRENVASHIHLPVQSGNNEVLKLMGRLNTRESYLEIFDKLRDRIKDVAITTDIIVAFPNETREQFEDTLSLYEYCKFDNAFSFLYSPRVGTPAAKMKDDVEMDKKKKRLFELQGIAHHWAKVNSETYVNKTLKVLVEGFSAKDDTKLSGYCEQWKVVNFTGDAKPGDIVDVKITSSSIYTLNGEMV